VAAKAKALPSAHMAYLSFLHLHCTSLSAAGRGRRQPSAAGGLTALVRRLRQRLAAVANGNGIRRCGERRQGDVRWLRLRAPARRGERADALGG